VVNTIRIRETEEGMKKLKMRKGEGKRVEGTE
jgi:hypothetical protein